MAAIDYENIFTTKISRFTVQCKHMPYSAVLSKSGKGRQSNVRDGYSLLRVFHVARGRKTLQMYGFPVQAWGNSN